MGLPYDDCVDARGQEGSRAGTQTLGGRRFLVATLLFIAGLPALVIGLHDLAFATELASRGLGFLLAVGGVLLTGSVLSLKGDRLKGAYTLCLVASAFGVFLWVLLIFVQLANGDIAWTLTLWPLLAGCSVAAGLLVASKTGWSRIRKGRQNLLTAVGSIASLGAVVALVQFIYTSLYVPSTAPPSLSLELAMVRAGRHLEPSITIRNTSDTGVTVLGSLYYVDISRVDEQTAKPTAFNEQLANPALADSAFGGPVAERYGKRRRRIVAEAGTVLPQEARLEAGEQTGRRFVVRIPRRPGRSRDAKLLVFVRFVRGAVKLRGEPIKVSRGQGARVATEYVTQVKLAESSWVRRIVRDKRYLERAWKVTPAGSPALGASIDRGQVPDQSPDEKTRARLTALYGFGSAGSTFELTLDDPGRRPRHRPRSLSRGR